MCKRKKYNTAECCLTQTVNPIYNVDLAPVSMTLLELTVVCSIMLYWRISLISRKNYTCSNIFRLTILFIQNFKSTKA